MQCQGVGREQAGAVNRQVLCTGSGKGKEGEDEEGEGEAQVGMMGPSLCPLQKGHGARRLVVLMPGGMEYLTRIRTFTVSFQL